MDQIKVNWEIKEDPILQAAYFNLNLVYQVALPKRIEIDGDEVVFIYKEETEEAISFYKNLIKERIKLLTKEKT